jgi:hypothetical protein
VVYATGPRLRGKGNSRAENLRKALLACGVLSALVYVGWHEVAALQWDGYSRISNAVSELHLTGAPSKPLLDPWEGIVYHPLVIAFGVGVWLSARGKRALQVVGALLVVYGVNFVLWQLFSEASLAVHLVLSGVSIGAMLGQMAFGAAAFGARFRLYSIATLITVLAAFSWALSYAPAVEAGDPTPYMGLAERVAFSAYFLWICVLSAALWRRRLTTSSEAATERRPVVAMSPGGAP